MNYKTNKPFALQPHPHCPTPLKDRFLSALEACQALEAIVRRTQAKEGPIRMYECECKGWHLTSQEQRPGKDGVIHVR